MVRQQVHAPEAPAHDAIPEITCNRTTDRQNDDVGGLVASARPQHPAGPQDGESNRAQFQRGCRLHGTLQWFAHGAKLGGADSTHREAHHVPNRTRERSLAFSASTSRSRAGELVCSDASRRRALSETSDTARLKASELACDGELNPESLRTNCSAEAWISA